MLWIRIQMVIPMEILLLLVLVSTCYYFVLVELTSNQHCFIDFKLSTPSTPELNKLTSKSDTCKGEKIFPKNKGLSVGNLEGNGFFWGDYSNKTEEKSGKITSNVTQFEVIYRLFDYNLQIQKIALIEKCLTHHLFQNQKSHPKLRIERGKIANKVHVRKTIIMWLMKITAMTTITK